MRTVLIFLMLAVLVGPAAAHSETLSQGQSIDLGPYIGFLEPNPTPLFANTSGQGFSLTLADAATGGAARGVKATMQLAGPEGYRKIAEFRDVDSRYKVATVEFPVKGPYTARVIVTDDAGEHFANTEFVIYPDLPFRVRPIDPSLDVTARVRVPLVYEAYDPIGGSRVRPFDDLSIIVEHFRDDHVTLISRETLEAVDDGSGKWRVEHVFPEVGHYFLKFSSTSGKFNGSDVPLLHIYAEAPPTVEPQQTPGPSVGLAFLAVGIALVARRR